MKTIFGYFFTAVLMALAIYFFYFANQEAQHVESFDKVVEKKIPIHSVDLSQESKFLDQNGRTFLEIRNPYRIVVSNKDIPDFMKELFLQSEDRQFYEHGGIDAFAVLRAMIVNSHSHQIEQGGSTITQQLARNLYLNYNKTFSRKLSEVFYAYELEKKLTKDQILNLYLNTIYFQNGVYGVEAASQFYFQKSVKDLTKAQMAFLAAIPNNPSLYNPLTHFVNTKKRQERLIDLMKKNGFLTAEEAEAAKKEPITLKLKKRIDEFPNYSTYVQEELKELIAEKEGYKEKLANANPKEKEQIEKQLENRLNKVLSSGIMIYTSLNPIIQQKAEHAVSSVLSYTNVEGAAAVIDNQHRNIIALVGGKDFHHTDFNRAYLAYRQPGSSIKPLLDYGPYIDRFHVSLSSLVNANNVCIGNYCPTNYSKKEYGYVTLKKAFANSYNTPAVRIFMQTGIKNSFSYLNKFGFEKVSERDENPSAAIGGFTYGMTPLEMTSAYTSFIDGSYKKPRAIQKVTDLKGHVLYQWKDEPVKIWSPDTVYKVRELMAEVVKNGTGKKAKIARPYVGGKTGTTNNYHDFWFVGLTDQYTAGVWVGRDTPSSIESLEHYGPQLLIWRKIMQ